MSEREKKLRRMTMHLRLYFCGQNKISSSFTSRLQHFLYLLKIDKKILIRVTSDQLKRQKMFFFFHHSWIHSLFKLKITYNATQLITDSDDIERAWIWVTKLSGSIFRISFQSYRISKRDPDVVWVRATEEWVRARRRRQNRKNCDVDKTLKIAQFTRL